MSISSIGKFQILGPLGEGAHSQILHIRRTQDGRSYALKVVPIQGKEDLKFLEQARHEFDIGQKLDHPNLIKIYTFETQRDWLFRVCKAHLLIEYVNGKTLDTCPRMKIPHLLQVFKAVSDGLVQMHRRQIYHADLKPNNIMLARSGAVKIIDFGLAWIKGYGKDRIQGTPEYMAPEQVRKKIVNESTDIFNFGATMYKMVTLRLPPSIVAEGGGPNINSKVWQQMLKPVSECHPGAPPELADLIHGCMAYHPESRPERTKEIQAALEQMIQKYDSKGEHPLESLDW